VSDDSEKEVHHGVYSKSKKLRKLSELTLTQPHAVVKIRNSKKRNLLSLLLGKFTGRLESVKEFRSGFFPERSQPMERIENLRHTMLLNRPLQSIMRFVVSKTNVFTLNITKIAKYDSSLGIDEIDATLQVKALDGT
jgi:hypothetical protein